MAKKGGDSEEFKEEYKQSLRKDFSEELEKKYLENSRRSASFEEHKEEY
jgi:hypothetical protein